MKKRRCHLLKKRTKGFVIIYFVIFYFIINFAAPVASTGGGPQPISIATALWVGNLNPFSFTSYPAQLIVEFTTDSLVVFKCAGSSNNDYEEGCHKKNKQSLYMDYDEEGSYFTPVLKPSPDEIRSPGLTFDDIDFTIKQIQKEPKNIYHSYELEFKKGEITISNPFGVAFHKAAMALTFPIIRNPCVKCFLDHNKVISVYSNDDLDLYNNCTSGKYMLASLTPNHIKLANRYEKLETTPVNIGIYDLFEQFLKAMMEDKHHVGLSLSGDLLTALKAKGTYNLMETDDLNSSTFFGFNYAVKDKKKNKLIHNVNFRQAFAYVVASTKTVKNKVKNYGETMNHTFDNMRTKEKDVPNKYNLDDIEDAKKRVDNFTRTVKFKQPINFNVLCRPNTIFATEHFSNIEKWLNRLFEKSKITFRFRNAPRESDYRRDKENGNFDIIFDTFYYGKNKLSYMEFLNPRNRRLNYLGCDIFTAEEIKKYKENPLASDEYLLRINREVPVYIIGTFHHKNVLAKSVRTSNPCENGRPAPFYNIDKWRLSK
ncbi:hypothetical protein GMMP15_1400008 [Candidatus Magnetomoraceae bacterium gMMP-15]